MLLVDSDPQGSASDWHAPRLADFGLAKVIQTTVADCSVWLSPNYVAPEVLEGHVAPWTDQYSLAVTYYQLRTGRLPFNTRVDQPDNRGDQEAVRRSDFERMVANATSLPYLSTQAITHLGKIPPPFGIWARIDAPQFRREDRPGSREVMAKLIGAQRMVLQAILDASGDVPSFVEDSQIARTTRIALKDVRDWLETLEGDEYVETARTGGWAGCLDHGEGAIGPGAIPAVPFPHTRP